MTGFTVSVNEKGTSKRLICICGAREISAGRKYVRTMWQLFSF